MSAVALVEHANFIGGTWSAPASGCGDEKRDPFRPVDLVGTFPASNERDVAKAIDAAVAAYPAWSRMPAPQRGAILMRTADILESRSEEIARDITREMGKPYRESRVEVIRGADTLRFNAGEGWRAQGEIFSQTTTGNPIHVLRRPLGRCRTDHTLELPLLDSVMEILACTHSRQYCRA